jgi:hypothetical protein
VAAVRGTVTKARDDVGAPFPLGVLKSEQKPACRRLIVAVIAAAPGIDINNPIRGDDKVPGMANIVREHGCAKAAGQRDPPIVGRAGFRLRGRHVGLSLRKGRRAGREHQSKDRKSHRSPAKADMTIFHDVSLAYDRKW